MFFNGMVKEDHGDQTKTVRLLVCIKVGKRTNSQARCSERTVLDLEYSLHAYFDDCDVEVTIVKLLVRQLV